MGRPRRDWAMTEQHWKLLELISGFPSHLVTDRNILHMMWTQAGLLGMEQDTMYRMVKLKYGLTFAKFRQQNSGMSRAKILAKQFEVAMKGNPAMLIWLGKQYLGQKENPEDLVAAASEKYEPPIGLTDPVPIAT